MCCGTAATWRRPKPPPPSSSRPSVETTAVCFGPIARGKAHIPAFLEDYAYLAEGLLDLFEAGGSDRWLKEATALAERTLSDFASDEGSFYNTAVDAERLIVRNREGNDGATPNPNAVAAESLARLSFHLGREDLRDAAVGALRAWGKMMARHPRAFPRSLAVVDLLLEGPVGAGPGGTGRESGALLEGTSPGRYLPNRVIGHAEEATEASPLLSGKAALEGRAALYVCRNFTCQAPATDPKQVEAALTAASPRTPRRNHRDPSGGRRHPHCHRRTGGGTARVRHPGSDPAGGEPDRIRGLPDRRRGPHLVRSPAAPR